MNRSKFISGIALLLFLSFSVTTPAVCAESKEESKEQVEQKRDDVRKMAIDYLLPFSNGSLLAVEFRWLPELNTKNRLDGDHFWLKFAYSF